MPARTCSPPASCNFNGTFRLVIPRCTAIATCAPSPYQVDALTISILDADAGTLMATFANLPAANPDGGQCIASSPPKITTAGFLIEAGCALDAIHDQTWCNSGHEIFCDSSRIRAYACVDGGYEAWARRGSCWCSGFETGYADYPIGISR